MVPITCRSTNDYASVDDVELLYIDFYPELASYFNCGLANVDLRNTSVFVNMSAISDIVAIPLLEFAPAIVQVSVSRNVSVDRAKEFSRRLLDKTGARMALVTMGHRGAAMAQGENTWHSVPAKPSVGSILGAGAVFSSQVILGLGSGLCGIELLSFAVKQTSERLGTWSLANEGDCS